MKTIMNKQFRQGDLESKDLTDHTFVNCDFERANLCGTDFTGSTLTSCDFTRADLSCVSFKDTRVRSCDFRHCNLTGTNFEWSRVELSDIQLADDMFVQAVGPQGLVHVGRKDGTHYEPLHEALVHSADSERNKTVNHLWFIAKNEGWV